MPKPVVLCPWPRDKRLERLAEIRALEARATASQPVLYVDEVDIHLNPRIGRDWMLPGQQRRIVTPGKNAKLYLDELDASWDSCQRKVNYRLAEHAESKEPEVQKAAERLRAQLLHGGGSGQTSFDYDQEVDFGRNQIELSKEPAAAADVKKLKMGDLLQEIADTTEALAKGHGRAPGTKRSGAPSIQQREAHTACSAAFNGVHDEIAWFIENTENGSDRDKLIELQAPFEALLARNPPRAAVAKGTPPAVPPATPPAAPTGE
jgi:hypothetical protein